jgi:hypothetical protein
MIVDISESGINILLLPKQYKRSEREKEQIPLFSSQQPRQNERGLAMCIYIGKGKLSFFFSNPLLKGRATSRPSAGRAHSRTVTSTVIRPPSRRINRFPFQVPM